ARPPTAAPRSGYCAEPRSWRGSAPRLAWDPPSSMPPFPPPSSFAPLRSFPRLFVLTYGFDDQLGKRLLDLIHVAKLRECPAPERAEIIDARHPLRRHGLGLQLRVEPPVALGLDDDVKRIVGPVAIVHLHDEVRHILLRIATVAIWHRELQPLVLDVGQHTRM